MIFHIGEFVLLHGLKNAKHYNGIAGLVMGEKNEEGRYRIELLDHEEGWEESNPDQKQECGGKTLKVKEANLLKSEDSKHWKMRLITCNGFANKSIHEIITQSPIGDTEDCEMLCQSIWDEYTETIPFFCLNKLKQKEICSEDVKGHKLFWIKCEAMMHHFLIEKSRGRFRFYQAYIDAYTAKEWCSLGTVNSDKFKHSLIWKKFGGGRTVGPNEIKKLFASIREIQDLIPALTPYLLKYVPNVNAQDVHDIGLIQKRRHDDYLIGRFQDILQICIEWSSNVINNIASLGITYFGVEEDDGKLMYDSSEFVSMGQGNGYLFRIPTNLYKKVQTANYNLTGVVLLNPAIFVKMVNAGLLWEFSKDQYTGGYSGFGFIATSCDGQGELVAPWLE